MRTSVYPSNANSPLTKFISFNLCWIKTSDRNIRELSENLPAKFTFFFLCFLSPGGFIPPPYAKINLAAGAALGGARSPHFGIDARPATVTSPKGTGWPGILPAAGAATAASPGLQNSLMQCPPPFFPVRRGKTSPKSILFSR